MNDSISKITLDLQQDSTPVTVAVKRGDTGRMIKILLSDGGFSYEIADGCYAVLTATKPDGNILYNHCSIEGNEIIYEITEQTTAAAGRMMAEIKLYGKDDKLITSATFRIIVSGTVYSDDKVESKDEVSALTHLISETFGCRDVAREAADAAEKAVSYATAAIADAEKAVEDAETATINANLAADRANDASVLAEQADAKVEKLREVVSKFHSNIVEEAKGDIITLDDASDMELAGLKIFGKTTQNGTPTPEAPVPLESVGDGGSVGVTVAGKNLLKGATEGYTHTTTADGKHNQRVLFLKVYLKQGAVCVSFDITKGGTNVRNTPVLKRSDGTGTSIYFNTAENAYTEAGHYTRSANIPSSGYYDFYWWDNNNSVSQTISNLMLVAGNTEFPYEPYKGQDLTIQKPADVPVLLPGIPVDNDNPYSNYTDKNGKKRVCDFVDLSSGEYTQKIGSVDMGTLNWNKVPDGFYVPIGSKVSDTGGLLCTAYVADNDSFWKGDDIIADFHSYHPKAVNIHDSTYTDAATLKAALSGQTLFYVLETPIRHDLTEEELAQYAALHTNYPNTTIFNDGGAEMEVKYVADTKLYIDKKFAELSVALLNN